MTHLKSLLIVSALIFLGACSPSSSSHNTNTSTTNAETASAAVDVRALEKLMPKDAALADKYKRSCFLCHANPDAKAPLVGNKVAWDKLIKDKGMPTLLAHINQGFNTMPAKGQCADCSDAEFEALVKFMAGLE